MIDIKSTKDGFEVIYNNKIIFRHSTEKPMLFLGNGFENIDFYRGNFKISDYVTERVALRTFEITNHNIKLSNDTFTCELSLSEVEDHLHIDIDSSASNRFWIQVYAEQDEKVFGLGEQASYFNLRNRNYPIWTSEPGVGRDKSTLTTFYADRDDRAGGDYYNTYYPEPTYISSRMYWMHVNSFAYADFNFKLEDRHELMFWETPSSIDLGVSTDYPNLIESLTSYTKRPPLLPEYVLDGMIIGVQGGTDQVLSYLEQTKKHDVKVSGVWCQDWAGVRYTSFGKRLHWNWKWNPETYPGLDQEIPKLNAENIHFLNYVSPFLLQGESLYNEATEKGYLALNKEHEVYNVDFGEFDCGLVDLTNPKAYDWFKTVIQENLIDFGSSGWMADFGEYLPHDAVLYSGVDAKVLHNEWPVLWAKCNYDAVKGRGKLGEIFYFMRAGGFGSQEFCTTLWAGDQSVNWETHDGIASTIPSALSAGMTGNPYTHSDIGGYTSLHGNIRTKELFDRWLEMSVFTSIMRSHEGNRPSENFQFYQSDDTLDLMSRMTQIRVLLKPYIKELFTEASTNGYPLQRPYFFHYPDDANSYDLQYEYFFGKDLVIKPVVSEHQETQTMYLPKGKWKHLFYQKVVEGPTQVTDQVPIGYPQVYFNMDSPYQELFEQINQKYGTGGEHE